MNRNTKVLILAALALQGCASTADIEARQLAWRRGESADNPCLWGGVSERAEAHCAEQRWGLEGYLMAINRQVLGEPSAESGATGNCQSHVAALQAALASRPELRTQVLYSCPSEMPDCHVSLLVSDAQGSAFVLDNGALLTAAEASAGVGSLPQFAALVKDNYRIVDSPARASSIMLAAQ